LRDRMAAEADRLGVTRHHVVAAGAAVGNDAVVAGLAAGRRRVGVGGSRRAGTLRDGLRAAGDGVVGVTGLDGVVAGDGAAGVRRVLAGSLGVAGRGDRLRLAGHQVLALTGEDR